MTKQPVPGTFYTRRVVAWPISSLLTSAMPKWEWPREPFRVRNAKVRDAVEDPGQHGCRRIK